MKDTMRRLMISQTINCFLTKPIPLVLVDKINTDDEIDVQEFIVNNAKDEFHWVTGLSIIESAEKIYRDAVENGNIVENKED